VLHGAAAAYAEMWADRLDALCARLLHADKAPAVGVTGHGVDFDNFAWQGPRDVNRPISAVGYSVAVLTQAVDRELLNHAPPR
jgi:hypothetical protein